MSSLQIIIVDDHPLMTFGVKAQFEAAGFADVLECADFRKLGMFIDKLHPDAVLFDLHMPGMRLERDFRYIKRKHFDIPFIAYTADNDAALVNRCRSLGFSGFVLKAELVSALTQKIRSVIDGAEVFPDHGASDKPASPLTGVQLNVLKLTAEGCKNSEIGEVLGIREATVDYHKRNIKAILGAKTSPEAVAIARAQQWI